MKKNSTIFFVLVVLFLALAIALGIVMKRDEGASAYSAVYLTTGDVYFGKLSWFPHPHMTNVWLLQRGVDAQNQPQLGASPFKNAVWGPMDEVTFSEKQIVFWTRLRSDSQVAKGFENPQSLQPEGTPAPK